MAVLRLDPRLMIHPNWLSGRSFVCLSDTGLAFKQLVDIDRASAVHFS